MIIKAQMMVTYFSSKVFGSEGLYAVFRHDAVAHFIIDYLQYSVNRTFICTGRLKKFQKSLSFFALLSGTEPVVCLRSACSSSFSPAPLVSLIWNHFHSTLKNIL